MPSTRSRELSMAARRAMVTRFPRPASTRRRVRSVSSRVRLPELPEARMETRNPMDSSSPQNAAFRIVFPTEEGNKDKLAQQEDFDLERERRLSNRGGSAQGRTR